MEIIMDNISLGKGLLGGKELPMKPKVYVTRRIPEPGISLLEECCEVTVHPHDEPATGDEVMKQVIDKDGLICLPGDKIDKAVMEKALRLKVISTFSVGFEHIDVGEATKRGIYVGYTPGILNDATADLAFTLLLSAARKIPQSDRFVRLRQWKMAGSPQQLFGTSVWGTTIGIVGLGRIGRAVMKRAKGFGMKVLYSDSLRLAIEEERTLDVEFRTLEDLLKESDFVSIHTPLTEGTYHLMDASRLRMMKATAILVNTSRGAVIDEKALATALTENWIAGAGLDVFEKEPLDSDNPLLDLDNVVIVPHMGSATTQTRSRMAEMAALNLLAVLKGEHPLSWLNPEVEKIRPLPTVKMIETGRDSGE
jgi:glyoxylate reductase